MIELQKPQSRYFTTEPQMAIQPHPDQDDLDRTDELPRLDVAAYEASLAGADKDTLSSTDTWMVESLRSEADGSSGEFEQPKHAQAATAQAHEAKDVTLDASRIFSRIAQLESELAAVKAQNHDLSERNESLQSSLTQGERQLQTLVAENSRLTESRAIAFEKLQTQQQTLQEHITESEQEIAQLRIRRDEERAAADNARRALEEQIAELRGNVVRSQDAQSRAQDELRAATGLAQERLVAIEQLKQRMAAEEKNTAQLALQLATKIAEHAALSAVTERRDATIRTLSTVRDELSEQLQQTRATIESLTGELAQAQQALALSREGEHHSRNETLLRDQQLEKLTVELQRIQAELQSAIQTRDAALHALTEEREHHARTQHGLAERLADINGLHKAADTARAQLAELRKDLEDTRALAQQRQTGIEELEHQLRDQLRRGEQLQAELADARRRAEELQNDSHALVMAREEFNEVADELRRNHQHLSRAREEIVALQTQLERQAGISAELAAVRRQLAQQAPIIQELEQAVSARDALAGTLRTELQTAQDERAIIAGQLQKSRQRNKMLAREIFDRDNRIAALEEDLAVHIEALAAIRQDVNRVGADGQGLDEEEPQRVLEPVDHPGDVIVLNRKVMTLGRTLDNDACIPSKLVSRHHARLLIGPTGVIVEDAGSTNGCFVNDREVKQQLMHDGDILSLGDLRYRLCTRSRHVTRPRDNVVSLDEARQ